MYYIKRIKHGTRKLDEVLTNLMDNKVAQGLLKYLRLHYFEYERVDARLEQCYQAIEWAEQQEDWNFIADVIGFLSYHFLYSSPAIDEELSNGQAFEEMRAFWKQGKELSIQGLRAAQNARDKDKQIELLGYLIRLAVFSEDFDIAMKGITQITHLVDSEDKWGVAYEILRMGQRACQSGHCLAGRDFYQMSHNLFQELGDEWAMADTLFFLGRAELETGNSSEARQSFERSLEVGERIKNLRLVAYALRELGTIYQLEGKPKQARATFRKALSVADSLKNESAELLRNELLEALASANSRQ